MGHKAGLSLVLVAVLSAAFASIAWAQGSVATLTLDKTVAAPGQAVTATGTNYSTAAGAGSVSIRLSTRGGKILATAAPDSSTRITSTFPVPASTRPGWYLVLATQSTTAGHPQQGTPGRTVLRVQGGAAAAGSAAVPPPGASKPAGPDGGLLALLAVGLLALGGVLVVRRGRPLNRPQFDN